MHVFALLQQAKAFAHDFAGVAEAPGGPVSMKRSKCSVRFTLRVGLLLFISVKAHGQNKRTWTQRQTPAAGAIGVEA